MLSFLLLVAVFRSLVIPIMAATMNVLSAGAAFGVLVAVFQWGWGDNLLGVSQTGPIEAFVPRHHVRDPVRAVDGLRGVPGQPPVYEEWHHSHDNRLAVTRGLAQTGRVITAAASIMILVFARLPARRAGS